MLTEAGLEVSAISSSITVCKPDKLEANLEKPPNDRVAHALGATNVRIFGGEIRTHSVWI